MTWCHIICVGIKLDYKDTKINLNKKNIIMFGRERNLNDLWRVFDDMFKQFDDVDGQWKTHKKVSDDGSMVFTSYFYGGNQVPKETNTKTLKQQLDIAIENEDFEKAVELRDKIKKLESNQVEIEKLELELKQSIKEQNFEKSIEIRDQLKKLK